MSRGSLPACASPTRSVRTPIDGFRAAPLQETFASATGPPATPKLPVSLAACLLVALLAAPSARADEGWASRDYDYGKTRLNDFISRFEFDLVDPVSRGLKKKKRAARAERQAARTAKPAKAAKAPTVPERVAQVPKQMAILGMFMALTQMGLQQQPDPEHEARMREAGKANLEQFLKIDPARVQITAQGLVLR